MAEKENKQKKANGDGSLRQRPDGRWELRITVGTGLDGKPIRKSFYDLGKTKVKEKYKEYLKQTKVPIEKVVTFSDWADNWLKAYKKDKIAYKTYSNYKGYLERHIKPVFGHLKLNQIKSAHIEQFYGTKREKSNAFQRDMHTILRGIFDKAVDNNLCSDNPMSKVKLPKKKEAEVEVFSAEELGEILKFAETHKYGYFILLLLYTGLRLGELLALRWTDVDFDEKIITVRRSIARVEKGSVEKETKTGNIRYIGITGELEEILKMLPRKGIYVLTNRNGNFYDDSDYRFFYSRFFKDLNESLKETDTEVRYLSPHKCRHTYATYMLRSGVNLRAVQTLLGHSTIKTTERYTHINLDEIKKAASMLKYRK